MNEQLQGKLVDILGSIQSATTAAGDFAMEQLPGIAMQYVAYGRIVHTTGLAAGIALACAVFVVLWAKRDCLFDNLRPAPLFVFFVATLLTAVNAGPAVLVWFAPKVWLLKELSSMLK